MEMKAEIVELNVVSDDHRRTLSEFGAGGKWKVCKVLKAKDACVVGDHYHKKKDECFLLLHGNAFVELVDESPSPAIRQYIHAPSVINVPRDTYHSFRLSSGAILIGLASEEHDPTDDYKI